MRLGAAVGLLLFPTFVLLQELGRRWLRPKPAAPIGIPGVEPMSMPSTAPIVGLLDRRALRFPVPAVSPGAVADSFVEPRSGHLHGALDILAPRGSPVVAVDDGTIARLSTSAAGGLAVYLRDSAERYCFFYAHLDGYVSGLVEGQVVPQGQVLGYVGTTGNAPRNTPHLHFAIFALDGTRECARGRPVNPYPLWR